MTQPNLRKPTVVSIHHDGVEVVRNEGGRWVELPESNNDRPTTIEFFFDGVRVYCLEGAVVLENRMTQLRTD